MNITYPSIPRNPTRKTALDFATYELIFASIAAGANAQQSFTVQSNSTFWWQALNVTADVAGAAQTDSTRVVPLVTIQIVDVGSGVQLFSNASPLPNVAGWGADPFALPIARPFNPTTQVQVTLTNYSAATAYLVRLSFIGMKEFDYGPA